MLDQSVERPSVQRVIDATEAFFEPAVRNREDTRYVSEKLALEGDSSDGLRIKFLNEAGRLLQSLHSAVKFNQTFEVGNQAYDSSLLLAVYKLVDFLLLEGVYPALPLRLGLLNERRSKSLLYKNHDPSYVPLEGSNQLDVVLFQIVAPVLKDVDHGIEPMLRHRVLPDIIVGNAWTAHDVASSSFSPSFGAYLDR